MRQFFVSKLQLETQIAGVRGQLRSLVANVEASRAGLEGAKSKYNLISEGTSSEDLDILESTVNAAQATYELAKLSLEYANVRAPQNGTIVQMTSHVGDVVTPGLSEMSLMDITKLTVIAYVLETELKDIKVGNQVKLSIDSFPGKTFKGTVQEVGEATSSVFTLFSSDNSSGNYAKVSQRVTIKITFDYIKNPVIPGMSTTAKIKITK
jgi:membrane fusion protein (multidrug efflux system)